MRVRRFLTVLSVLVGLLGVSMAPTVALAGAPVVEQQRFRVPRILDEE